MIRYTIRHWVRFVQYALLGTCALGFDLLLLYTFMTWGRIPYSASVPLAFIISTSIHYVFLRLWIFSDTNRQTGIGYAYFILIMLTNALLITALVVGLVEYGNAPLYPTRIAVGACFGFVSFFVNSRYNFRVL